MWIFCFAIIPSTYRERATGRTATVWLTGDRLGTRDPQNESSAFHSLFLVPWGSGEDRTVHQRTAEVASTSI